MSIVSLPTTQARQHEVRAALESQSTALLKMLDAAVATHGVRGLRVAGSPEDDQRLAVTAAYLYGAEAALDSPGLSDHLSDRLNAGQYDISKLADEARAWAYTPEAA